MFTSWISIRPPSDAFFVICAYLIEIGADLSMSWLTAQLLGLTFGTNAFSTFARKISILLNFAQFSGDLWIGYWSIVELFACNLPWFYNFSFSLKVKEVSRSGFISICCALVFEITILVFGLSAYFTAWNNRYFSSWPFLTAIEC